MFSKNDGRQKKRQICSVFGWEYSYYPIKLYDWYIKENISASEIATELNAKMPKWFGGITTRSIQRAIVTGEKLSGKHNTRRTALEGFKLAVTQGKVKWAYKSIKAKKCNIGQAKRFRILTRDGFKCVLCGSTAKDDILNVDHIIPLAHNGTDDDDNLRVLCSNCSVGKRIVDKEK